MQVVENRTAEENYIGCILNEGELVQEARLQPKHFYHPEFRLLYEKFQTIASKNEPIDIVSIITYMGQGKLQQIGGREYLSDLMNSIASTEPFNTYEKYILEAYKVREANRIKQQAVTNPESISQLIQDLSELEREDDEEEYNHRAEMIGLREELEQIKDGLTGIDTGLADYNRMTDGFQKHDLIISAARPSMGKTAKALQHVISACEKSNAVVPIFSLEMGKRKLLRRIYASVGGIDAFKLKNPMRYFDKTDWEKLANAEGVVEGYDIEIYDKSGQTVQDIIRKVRRMRREYPDRPMLVVIDYLQLIRSNVKFERKDLEVGEITRTLKEMAKDYDCSVYLLSQLSRGVEQRQDKRPMMSDIRESGAVEQDADLIEFLYRDDYYDAESDKENILEIIIAKQRDGEVGTVEVMFLREYNKILDLDTRREG